jgi:membrane associated rhomboid family serine protease
VASLVPIFFIFTLVEIPALIFLGFWFISQLFSGWLALGGADMSGVAWWAHVGGFVFGILAVSFFARRRY